MLDGSNMATGSAGSATPALRAWTTATQMTRCDLSLNDPDAMIEHLTRGIDEAYIDRPANGHIRVFAGRSCLTLSRRRTALRLVVRAAEAEDLVLWRESVTGQVVALDPAAGDAMRWIGGPEVEKVGARPANFRTARVVKVIDVMLGLVRMIADLDAPLACEGHHVRLAVPAGRANAINQVGAPASWPIVGANGATVWPGGADILHRRAYTFRFVSPDRRRITVDAVKHIGGRTADWIAVANPGDTFGLTGPGSAQLPETDGDLVVAGDMSALPAMARIIEALPEARIRAWAACPTQADADAYFGPGRVTAIPPARFATELPLVLAREAIPDAAWFAGEHETAVALRALFQDAWGLDRARGQSVAYWRHEAASLSLPTEPL